VQRGRLPAGERYDETLASALDAEPDTQQRQLIILDWFFRQYQTWLPADAIVQYEDVVKSRGGALSRALGASLLAAEGIGELDLVQRFPQLDMKSLLQGLLEYPGSWRERYPEATLRALIQKG
jgi:hypothetical protein